MERAGGVVLQTTGVAAPPSLRKLKRDASQRRKLHARSLRLRAEEQERLQRLEIDALVQQQRLERQRGKEGSVNRKPSQDPGGSTTVPTQAHGKAKSGEKQLLQGDRIVSSNEGTPTNKKNQKDGNWRKDMATEKDCVKQQRGTQQQPNTRATAAESRRRLARGPRSGGGSGRMNINAAVPALNEDHRVLSIEYNASATQAVMKVTILAAGFVIGARGISARLIGQVTGAVVHSWTECGGATGAGRSLDEAAPVRLFRIEGKKAAVQAAVALIQEAVTKYKELCECKRRGEFVQREHLIGGVEFYYQPPPRKALGSKQQPPRATACPPNFAGSPAQHHTWPQHRPSPPPPPPPSSTSLPCQPFLFNWHLSPTPPPPLPESLVAGAPPLPSAHLLPFRPPPLPISGLHSGSSIASIEQNLHQIHLENRQLPRSSTSEAAAVTLCGPAKNSPGQAQQQRSAAVDHVHCSLFSVFGNGGHPVPIAQAAGPVAVGGAAVVGMSSATSRQQLATSAFEFSACDFLRESLPAFSKAREAVPEAAAASAAVPEYCLFGQRRKLELERTANSSIASTIMCVACRKQPAAMRLMTCGHSAICFSCVHGKVACPICPENIAGLQTPRTLINIPSQPDLIHWPPLRAPIHDPPKPSSS